MNRTWHPSFPADSPVAVLTVAKDLANTKRSARSGCRRCLQCHGELVCLQRCAQRSDGKGVKHRRGKPTRTLRIAAKAALMLPAEAEAAAGRNARRVASKNDVLEGAWSSERAVARGTPAGTMESRRLAVFRRALYVVLIRSFDMLFVSTHFVRMCSWSGLFCARSLIQQVATTKAVTEPVLEPV